MILQSVNIDVNSLYKISAGNIIIIWAKVLNNANTVI